MRRHCNYFRFVRRSVSAFAAHSVTVYGPNPLEGFLIHLLGHYPAGTASSIPSRKEHSRIKIVQRAIVTLTVP